MITLAWYNVAAIIAGVIFIFWFYVLAKDCSLGAFQKWLSFVVKLIVILSVVIFYAVWGGIFWW